MNLGGLPHNFRIFAGEDLDTVLRQRICDLQNAIDQTNRNIILNSNEADLILSFTERYTYDPVQINFEAMTMSEKETYRQVQDYGRIINQKGQIYRFHIPVSGELGLLKMTPNPSVLRTHDFLYDHAGEIAFEIFGGSGEVKRVVKEKDSIIKLVTEQLGHANNQINNHNNSVQNIVSQHLQKRKQEILRQIDTVSAIGIPLKKNEDVSKTFTVPSVKIKPKIIDYSQSKEKTFKPEPVLHESQYNEILKLIRDFGVEIERHPSIYEGKDEESLRDHFILILSPHFEGGVTGETFNKSGKTDILIRYESSNVFVAECKFWRGQKSYSDAIDQILGYLTWRDSKASLICFVDNAQFNPVLETIQKATPEHASYAETLHETEGIYKYRFCLPNDRTRNVFLTVMCFHFPKK